MAEHGLTRDELAVILWPEANLQTRRVLIGKWLNRGIVTVRMDQLQDLYNRFGPNIIDYEEKD
jgi:hypothetical protein